MKSKTCCFAGCHPQSLPWGFDETDPRCVQFKARLREEIERVVTERKIRRFIIGMTLGADTYAAEIVLVLRDRYPITLECALAHEGQADRWEEPDRDRYFSIVERCDRETMLQTHYTLDCVFRRNRYMVDHSKLLLAVYNGYPGGTAQTVNYAKQIGREIILIDPESAPFSPPLRLL